MTSRTLVYYTKVNLTEMSDAALASRATELERTVFRLRAELEYVARNDSHNVAERQRIKGEIQEVSDELHDTELEQHFRRENPPSFLTLSQRSTAGAFAYALMEGQREARSYFPSMR